jgi:hypothetical protein
MAAHQCPKCGHSFSVPDWLDTEIKCPNCTAPVRKSQTSVPGPQPPAQQSRLTPDVESADWVSGAPSYSPAAASPAPIRSSGKPLNDARVRSLMAGAFGGFVGWLGAERLIGGPAGLVETLCVGAVVGLAIAATLGGAEGVVIRSWRLARRGLVNGLVIGAIGGALGAGFGQWTYAATASRATPSSPPANAGSFIRPTFSPEVAKRIEREGGETGEIEIALIWKNRNDLDLHVVDPQGEEISFLRKTSASGGWLDIDQNAACSSTIDDPVEHVRWKADVVPNGTFRVYVNHYSNCGAPDPTEFHVEVKNGNKVAPFDGIIRYGDAKVLVHSFVRDPHADAPMIVRTEPATRTMMWAGIVCGWLIFGIAVGCAEGITRRSVRALRNAALGGAIGGLVGGIALLGAAEIGAALSAPTVANAPIGPHVGWIGRMLGFAILGACVGLWIVLVERALSAMLAVCSGQYEGREIFLDKREMRIGRNDALEIYLGGDRAIADHHATIQQEGNAHVIAENGSKVLVNDSPRARCTLKHGDFITLGTTRLIYKHRPSAPDR